MSRIIEPGNRFAISMDLAGTAAPGNAEVVTESGANDLHCALYFADIQVQKPGATTLTSVTLSAISVPLSYEVPAVNDPVEVALSPLPDGSARVHGYAVGQTFTVTFANDTDTGFNGTYTATATSTSAFTVAYDNDPATIVGDGTVVINYLFASRAADWQGTGMEQITPLPCQRLEAVSTAATTGTGRLMVAGSWR